MLQLALTSNLISNPVYELVWRAIPTAVGCGRKLNSLNRRRLFQKRGTDAFIAATSDRQLWTLQTVQGAYDTLVRWGRLPVDQRSKDSSILILTQRSKHGLTTNLLVQREQAPDPIHNNMGPTKGYLPIRPWSPPSTPLQGAEPTRRARNSSSFPLPTPVFVGGPQGSQETDGVIAISVQAPSVFWTCISQLIAQPVNCLTNNILHTAVFLDEILQTTKRITCTIDIVYTPTAVPRAGRFLSMCKICNSMLGDRPNAGKQIGINIFFASSVNHLSKSFQNLSSDVGSGRITESIHVTERNFVQEKLIILVIEGGQPPSRFCIPHIQSAALATDVDPTDCGFCLTKVSMAAAVLSISGYHDIRRQKHRKLILDGMLASHPRV